MAGNRGSKKIHPRMQREALRFIVNKRLAPPYEDPSWREVKEHLDGWVRKTRFGLETGESFYDMGYTSPERSKIYSLIALADNPQVTDLDQSWSLGVSKRYGLPNDSSKPLSEMWRHCITAAYAEGRFTVRMAHWTDRLRWFDKAGGSEQGSITNIELLYKWVALYSSKEMLDELEGKDVDTTSLDMQLHLDKPDYGSRLLSKLTIQAGLVPEVSNDIDADEALERFFPVLANADKVERQRDAGLRGDMSLAFNLEQELYLSFDDYDLRVLTSPWNYWIPRNREYLEEIWRMGIHIVQQDPRWQQLKHDNKTRFFLILSIYKDIYKALGESSYAFEEWRPGVDDLYNQYFEFRDRVQSTDITDEEFEAITREYFWPRHRADDEPAFTTGNEAYQSTESASKNPYITLPPEPSADEAREAVERLKDGFSNEHEAEAFIDELDPSGELGKKINSIKSKLFREITEHPDYLDMKYQAQVDMVPWVYTSLVRAYLSGHIDDYHEVDEFARDLSVDAIIELFVWRWPLTPELQ